jgi:PleD family two-component response regulator
MMTDISLSDAVAVVESARMALDQRIQSELGTIPVTFSAGVAEALPGLSWEITVRLADALLYDAKEAGRDRVRSAQIRGGVGAARDGVGA